MRHDATRDAARAKRDDVPILRHDTAHDATDAAHDAASARPWEGEKPVSAVCGACSHIAGPSKEEALRSRAVFPLPPPLLSTVCLKPLISGVTKCDFRFSSLVNEFWVHFTKIYLVEPLPPQFLQTSLSSLSSKFKQRQETKATFCSSHSSKVTSERAPQNDVTTQTGGVVAMEALIYCTQSAVAVVPPVPSFLPPSFLPLPQCGWLLFVCSDSSFYLFSRLEPNDVSVSSRSAA